jgi:hypothetical protein
MPTKADNGQTVLTIGDVSRNGLLQIVDTSWDSNGTLFVTVRELIGDRVLVPATSIERMRRLARRALMYPELTRSSRVTRKFYADGCTHVTFAVSRNDSTN